MAAVTAYSDLGAPKNKIYHCFHFFPFYLPWSHGTQEASLVTQLVKNMPAVQETPFWFLGWEVTLEKGELPTPVFLGFPGGSVGKESTCNAGVLGLIPGLGRSPGGGHVNPLQHSCLKNPHGQRSLEGYSPWGHKESDMSEQLRTGGPKDIQDAFTIFHGAFWFSDNFL